MSKMKARTVLGKPIHPLHPQEFVDDLNRTTEGGYACFSDRRTGKSTAQALAYVSKAIKSPGVPIALLDHHGTVQCNSHLAKMVTDIIAKLGLLHLHIGCINGFTLTFENRQGN